MKKTLCALLAALLLLGCLALAEEEPEIIDIPQVEIVQLDEGDVSVRSVGGSGEDAPEAEEAASGGLHVEFEDGFALDFPEGWLYHPTTEAMAEQGVAYCLSDADGAGWLYVQNWDTDCADMDALKALVDRTTGVQASSVHAFNGTDFVVYELTEEDASCCAALLGDRVLNFVFSPQSDADFMAVVAQILNTFALI